MSQISMTTPGADLDAIARDLDHLASLTEPGRGVTRLAFTALERDAHKFLRERYVELGLHVWTDAAGNTIAELPASGDEPVTGAIATGSHLDSVPEGGRFDGIAGVVTAMEVARIASTSGRVRRHPWRFVAFAAEEGARFGQACNGSRMVVGLTHSPDLEHLHDKHGISMAEAMRSVGLRPDDIHGDVWQPQDWAAFVELHIEQGTVLDHGGEQLGVVDVVSGSTRFQATITGVASHSGGAPMRSRRDALTAAAECVLAGERIALDYEHHGTRVTVGRLEVSPGSITTIPGVARFSVDVRDVDSDRQRSTAKQLAEAFEHISQERGTSIEVELLADTSPVRLSSRIAATLLEAMRSGGLDGRTVTSGASHDAQQVSRMVPTGMIFVPSRDGLSHVPEEYTAVEHLGRGANALLEGMYRLDSE